MKRHTCIICKRKRNEFYMKKVLINSWACNDTYSSYRGFNFSPCCDNKEIRIAENIIGELKEFKYLNVRHISGNCHS